MTNRQRIWLTLLRICAQLTAKGFHGLTTWWEPTLERFFGHPTWTTLVGEIGRGGVKSGSAVLTSIAVTIGGDWKVPLGDPPHYFAFVSATKSEASQRLRQLEHMLTALGIPYDRSGDEIVLKDMPRGFRVFACQIGAVSGFRCFGFAADELAKWTSDDKKQNPAAEVIASLRAMTVTHPGAIEILISSPVGKRGFHFERVSEGDTAKQMVVHAPTWEANPSISEQFTRELEPDQRIWAREYAARPQDAALGAFPPDAVNFMFKPRPELVDYKRAPAVILLDPSSGGETSRDWFTFAGARWCHDMGAIARRPDGSPIMLTARDPYIDTSKPIRPPILSLSRVDGIAGGFAKTIGGDEIAQRIASLARTFDTRKVFSDQREDFFLASTLRKLQQPLWLVPIPWTGSSKPKAVELVRRWLLEKTLHVDTERSPEWRRMRQELLEFEEDITPSGQLTFGARGSRHDDFVALLVTLGHAEILAPEEGGGLPRSPLRAEPRPITNLPAALARMLG